MKLITPLVLMAALCGSSLLTSAQQPATTPPAQAGNDKPVDWKKLRDRMEELPEDVRKRFHDAREEALKDPEIQALREKAESANKELREAMRKAIAEKNPELAEQLEAHFKTSQEEPKKKEKKRIPGEKFEAAIEKLPPAKRSRLEAAREIAKQAPAVQSAEAAMQSTPTPEARREAALNFRKAMRDAMLTADPSLSDVLDKIKPAKPEPIPSSAKEQAE